VRRVCRSVTTILLGVFAALLAGLTPSVAQTSTAPAWPQRTVHLVLTLGAGSASDISARLLADRLTKRWGQPVVVENRPGGDGIVAINAFVSAQDDHVLLFAPTSSFTAHPYLHNNVQYKPGDLAPIARVSNTFVGITVPSVAPVASLRDLAALVKSKPGQLNWAGVTGANSFMFEGWLKVNNLDMKKVPYRNAIDAANDLAENRVQVYASAIAIAQPQLEAGKIKLLAVINTERSPSAPNVPTATEAGYPALTNDGLVGLFGPPSMPMALRERIAADIKAVMESDPIIKDRLIATGQLFNPGGPAEFGASIDEQRARVKAAANALGIAAKQ
jgi:tripartite-type tricarboxylate transporter receptor subunit TctC